MGKTKKDTTTERPRSRVDRRLFIQGMGVAAAATVTGLSNRDVVANTKIALSEGGSGILGRSPVVMIWRRISDLYETKAFVKKTLGLPVIGQDPITNRMEPHLFVG